jgi:hypothetical protein
MGNPFLFADRFSGAVVHLTTGNTDCLYYKNGTPKTKCPRQQAAQAFLDKS